MAEAVDRSVMAVRAFQQLGSFEQISETDVRFPAFWPDEIIIRAARRKVIEDVGLADYRAGARLRVGGDSNFCS
jgi:hypothetical protein